MYFDEKDKVTWIVHYDDSTLVKDMTLSVATARLKELREA